MPFKSEKQRKFLWANNPEVARRWAEKYKKGGYAVTITPRGFGKMLPSKKQKTTIYV